MACKVSVKDIESKIRNEVIDKFGSSAKPTNGGKAVFIAKDISTKSIGPTLQLLEIKLNNEYGAKYFGPVISYSNEAYGYEVSIHPSQELADGMTAQNQRDEMFEEVGQEDIQYAQDPYESEMLEAQGYEYIGNRDTEMGNIPAYKKPQENFSFREQKQNQENNSSRNSAQKQNAKRPITDNYVEYKRYKETKLEKSNRILTSLHRDKRNPKKDSKVVMADIARYAKIQADLKQEIDFLDKHEPDLLFKGIQQDIDKLNTALDTATNIDTIKEDLDFLYKLVKGQSPDNAIVSNIEPLAGFKHAGFESISAQVDALSLKYKEKLKSMTQELINQDISYANNVMDNATITPEQLADMFHSPTDLSWMEKTLLGITSASSNDTIIPQILKSFLETKTSLREAEAKVYQDKLNKLMKQLEKTGFDFIFEKDNDGIETGNIINLIAPKFNTMLTKYFAISKNEKLSKEIRYQQKVKWLKANTEVINPMKLSAVHAVYKDIYPEHFKSYSEEDAAKYEAFLQERLGPLYEEEIEKQLHTLENFQLQKESIEEAGGDFVTRNILRIDPWAFVNNYNSPSSQDALEYTVGTSLVTDRVHSDIQNIRFIPIKEVFLTHDANGDEVFTDSGYYNKDFQELAKDPVKLEYWQVMKEVYTEYINPTYNNSSFTYAKFEDEWAEAIHKAKGLHKGTVAFKQAVSGYKGYFYERGNYKEKSTDTMTQNYHDTSGAEIKTLATALEQLPTSRLAQEAKTEGVNTVKKTHKQIAYNLARKKVLTKYSTDINKVTGALLQMTALQKAREDTLPIANVLLDAHKLASKNDEGIDVRERSVKRMEHFIERVIRGEGEKYRGGHSFIGKNLIEDTAFGRSLDKLSQIPFIGKFLNKQKAKFLTPAEKELVKYLEELREKGHNSNEEYQFSVGKINFVLRIGKDGKRRYLVNKEGTLLEVTTKEDYEANFQTHITDKISEIGLDINGAGIIQGILKTIILKGLALNPISGIFNRIEGKNSGLIMDQTGEFWTAGNIHQANNFMMFVNFLKFVPDRFTPQETKKIQELEKLKILVGNMNLIQDRKNELERQSDKSKFDYDKYGNLYQFAVENPEFKNQGAILLAILMDTKIKDVAGNEVAIFNGSEFPAHDNVDGKLVLKPEFRSESNITNWEDFNINEKDIKDNQYFMTRMKIKNAISKSQGNYDNLDVIDATRTIWGRSLTIFMKWMPEHFMQRFAAGTGFDTTTGKQKLRGRYRYLYRNNPALLTSGIMSLFVLYGMSPISMLAGLGFTGFVAAKYFKNLYNKKSINNETNNAIDFIGFTKSVVISTLNYPLEFFNSNKLISHDIGNKFIPGLSQSNLSEREAQNLQAVAKELGIKLAFIAFMLLAKRLTWDDDDDKDADKRQLHNFLDNQLSRIISSLTNWQDPGALVTDVQRLAFLKYLINAQATLGSILTMDEKGKLNKQLFDVSPIPRILGRPFLPGPTAPWKDEREYQNTQWQDRVVKNWSSGNEWEQGKKYEKLRRDKRQEFRDEYKDLGLERDALEDAVDEAMKQEFPKRKSGETASSILERIESGEKGKPSKKKKK